MRRRRTILSILFGAIAAFLVFRRSGNGDDEIFPPPDPALSQPVIPRSPNGMTFDDSLRALTLMTNALIFVRWEVLEGLGITPDRPMSRRIRDETFEGALRDVLSDADGGAGSLGFRMVRGSVVITALQDARPPVCRMYEMGDLLGQVGPVNEEKWGRDGMLLGGWRFAWQEKGDRILGSGDWIGVSFGSSPYADATRRHLLNNYLSGMLAAREPWKGGRLLSIEWISDRLVIVASPDVQQIFSGLLKELRQHRVPPDPIDRLP